MLRIVRSLSLPHDGIFNKKILRRCGNLHEGVRFEVIRQIAGNDYSFMSDVLVDYSSKDLIIWGRPRGGDV